jgi:hypothetical protein
MKPLHNQLESSFGKLVDKTLRFVSSHLNPVSISFTPCQESGVKPVWAELYNQAAGVYVDCPDPAYRNPEKAAALIEHAIALDLEHPEYLTVLALAYFRSGYLEKAVITQTQALESPKFPAGYREEATVQLREYERALAAQSH